MPRFHACVIICQLMLSQQRHCADAATGALDKIASRASIDNITTVDAEEFDGMLEQQSDLVLVDSRILSDRNVSYIEDFVSLHKSTPTVPR